MLLAFVLLSFLLFSFAIFSGLKLQEGRLFKFILSTILSASILGLLFSVSLFSHLSFMGYVVVLLCVDVLSVMLLVGRQPSRLLFHFSVDSLLLLFSALILLGTLFFWYKAEPWGGWDAWAIWNLHAKFLFYEDAWNNLFTNEIGWTHPDYPLMLPSLIALLWKTVGSVSPMIPALLAYFVFVCILCLIYSSRPGKQYRYISLVGVVLLILDYHFIREASSQYADTLVGLYILLSTILLGKEANYSSKFYLLIGFMASLPIWVKNEGIVFFVFLSFFVLINNLKKREKILYYLVGTMPMVILFSWFKIVYAPGNDITSAISLDLLDKVFAFDKYITIAIYLVYTVAVKFPLLIVFALFLFFNRPRRKIPGIVFVLLTSLAAYLFVYVITPYDITWHISTSLNRLIHQLYPAFVYCMVLYFYNHPQSRNFITTFLDRTLINWLNVR